MATAMARVAKANAKASGWVSGEANDMAKGKGSGPCRSGGSWSWPETGARERING